MTLSNGDYLLGAHAADGKLLVIPSGAPLNEQYCVLARTGDERRIIMQADPMRAEGAVGFLGTAADGLAVAFGAGPALCIPEQSLGYGISWMAYPASASGPEPEPFTVNVNVASAVPQLGRDALIGAWADWLVGQPFGGFFTPDGIDRNWSICNLNMEAMYPFLQPMPHHLDGGVPSLDLSGSVPAATDGIWMHSEPMPLVMSRRVCIGPGLLQMGADPQYWPFNPQPGTPSTLPMDIRSTRQLFLNLKAWLDFAPNNDIRLNLRMFVVIVVGRMGDFNWAAPITIQHPLGGLMSCPGTLDVTGFGTPCCAPTMWGDVESLGCHCICTAYLLSQCADLDMGINTITHGGVGGDYYACGTDNPARKFQEIAIHGGDTREATASWPYGQEPSDVTAARVLDVFGATGQTINEWVAAEFASRFAAAPLAIDNTSNQERLDTAIVCHCAPVDIGTTLPPELAGTHPLPTDDPAICLPSIPKIVLSDVAGWRGRTEDNFRYMLTEPDAYAAAKNPNKVADLGLSYVNSGPGAYQHVCKLWSSWVGVQAAIGGILAGSELTNLPLRTDCFENGLDPGTQELVFGYPFPSTLYGPTEEYRSIDLAQDILSLPLTSNLTLKAPRDNLADWVLVAQGGGMPSLHPMYVPPPCLGHPTDPPECWSDPDDSEYTCDILAENYAWIVKDEYPKHYLLRYPQVEIRVKLEGCYLKVRVAYRNWLLRETTTWLVDYHSPGVGAYLADLPDEKPWLTSMGIIEISRGAQVTLPCDFSGCYEDQGGAFTDGILNSRFWTRTIATGRLLVGCLADEPGHCTVAGENSLEVYI